MAQNYVSCDTAVVNRGRAAHPLAVFEDQASDISHATIDSFRQSDRSKIAEEGVNTLTSKHEISQQAANQIMDLLSSNSSPIRAPLQQTPALIMTTNTNPPNELLSSLGEVHEVSPGKFRHTGSALVIKATKQPRIALSDQSRLPAKVENSLICPNSTAIDTVLEAVRATYLADLYQIESRMSSTIKELEGKNRQLQETVSQQLDTMTEQRIELSKEKECRARFAETAKSNQKYVAGLQKDHEKLKKSVISYQEQAKQTLQAGLVGLKEEKKSWEGELDGCITAVSKGQKAMRSTMEELNSRCNAAEWREHELQKQLEKQARTYEDEKNRRIRVGEPILPLIRSMQSQLEGSFAILVERFNSLRTDLLESDASKQNDLSTAKDCLLDLRKLQISPPLTSGDVRRAEAMLRLLHKRLLCRAQFSATR